MRIIFSTFFMLGLSLSLFSQPVEIMYYDFFGEYLKESSYEIDIQVENMSLAQIKAILANKRENQWPIESDLAIIGYGPNGYPNEFFAAFDYVNNQSPLKEALPYLPTRVLGSKWYIYFVNKNISNTVRKQKDHHWASPLRWLAQIGLQDLRYIGQRR